MTHLWIRAEERDNEQRIGITPDGVAALLARGIDVTIEDSATRCLPLEPYYRAGAIVAQPGSWRQAPEDAIVFGLKELPDDGLPLKHRHIMFGHAFKGQPAGQKLLSQFKLGGGALYDLEYLVDETGRRVAAFGYWAGYAGAAVSVKCWVAQQMNTICPTVNVYSLQQAFLVELKGDLVRLDHRRPTALIIGAHGRVGTGAADLCRALGIHPTLWDVDETASGGPFPQILEHDLFLNCILARPGTPVFVPQSATSDPRNLSVIGDISCDPDSDFSPIKVYDRVTTWAEPALRVHDTPPLDVMAIDNLPSLLPTESSQDFAEQLLPSLLQLGDISSGVWGRAKATFDQNIDAI